jgi:endonuclease YncB( thermonuclease family)
MIKTFTIIFSALLVLGCAPAGNSLASDPSYPARVVAVADGNAITVLDAGNNQIQILLYGIDCPERRQPYGNRARQATADAIHGKTVNVHPIEADGYGRTLALVAAPGREMLNSWLVKEGLAWVYPQYCKREDICDRLLELEQEAKENKAGLWADGKSEKGN